MKNLKSLLIIFLLAVSISIYGLSVYIARKHNVLVTELLFPKDDCDTDNDCHLISCGPGLLLRCVQMFDDRFDYPQKYYPSGCDDVPGVMDVSNVGCYCNKGRCSTSAPITMDGVEV